MSDLINRIDASMREFEIHSDERGIAYKVLADCKAALEAKGEPVMTAAPEVKYEYVCTECESTNVYTDAWAEWDKETQAWVVANTFDNCYCNNCEGECKIERKEIAP